MTARDEHVPFRPLVLNQQAGTNDESENPQGGEGGEAVWRVGWGELPALREGETAQKEGSLHIPEAESGGKSILILATPSGQGGTSVGKTWPPAVHFLLLI